MNGWCLHQSMRWRWFSTRFHLFSEGKSGVKFAAIGPKTAEALQTRGVTPDFVPEEYVAEAILPGLGDLKNKWVLLPRAEIARKELPEAIFKAGGIAHEIVVYQTLPAQIDMDGLTALKIGRGCHHLYQRFHGSKFCLPLCTKINSTH